jgi:hypothetical protein
MRFLKPILLFFFIVNFQYGFCQTKKPLLEILPVVEQHFNIKFSFADADVTTVTINTPNLTNSTLSSIITFLEKETNLFIEQLNKRYYTISKFKSEVCGTLVNTFSNNPVMGATIELLDHKRGVVSNVDGVFTIQKLPKGGVLQIKHIGYKPYFIKVEDLDKNNCKTLYLTPKSQQLEEVTVYHFLTSGLEKEKDGSFTLNSAKFGILPGLIEPDVLQTIQALPGIKSINETVSNINIRGGTNDQNLLLWDGIKMYQSGHFFGLISAFNPYLTESVKIIKNGTTAQYTDGVSGTISMQSINNLSDSFFGGAGINLVNADLYAQIPINKKMALQFSGRRSVTDFLNTPTYNQYFDRAFQDSKITNNRNEEIDQDISRDETFYFYDFSSKLLYDINDDHKLRASFININNNLDYAETITRNDSSETKESTLDQTNLAFGGNLTSSWSERFKTELSAYYTKYNLDASNLTLFTDQEVLLNNEVLETGAKLNTFITLDNLTFLNGYQFYEVGVTNAQEVNIPQFKQINKDVLRNHALFSEVTYQNSSKTTFVRAGVRGNYIEKFGSFILEPRLSFQQTILPKVTLEILGELKSQTVNQIIDLQQDFLGVEKRRWVLANNQDLPITKSRQVSLGFNYSYNGFLIGLEGFYKNVDGITTTNQGFQNQGQFSGAPGNYGYLGEYTVNGLEFLINKQSEKYSTWLSYTYNKNDYEFQGVSPSKFPNNLDIRHAITFGSTYTYNKLKLALGLNWHTGKPFTEPDPDNPINEGPVTNEINYQSPNSSRLDDYFRVDVSTIYNFDISRNVKATLGASILNILNRKNTLNTYYRLNNPQDTEVQKIENISLGITPNVSFRVQF